MRTLKLILGVALLMAATACTVSTYDPGYRYHYYSYGYGTPQYYSYAEPQYYSYYRYAP